MERRIFAAAVELFAEKGFAATGIREIADRVGVSSAALYHYMGTKEDLLVRIMQDSNERLLAAARGALRRVDRPEEQLAALVVVHVWTHANRRLEALVGDQELRALSPESLVRVMGTRDAYERLWRKALERGAAEGVFEIGDPRLARLALIEMCTGVATWYSPTGRLDAGKLGRGFVDLALGMVRCTRNRRRIGVDDVRLPDVSALETTLVGAHPGSEDSSERLTSPLKRAALTG